MCETSLTEKNSVKKAIIVTPKQMQALDSRTMEDYKIPALILMENAGREVTESILHYFSEQARRGVLVVVGPGQNGGDGLVVARHLFQKGIVCNIISLIAETAFKKEAAINLEIVKKLGIRLCFAINGQIEGIASLFWDAGVIVDAIFGIGLSRAVEGHFRWAIEQINTSPAKVVAVDVPSGISAHDGSVLGCAVKADLTVTMGFEKTGHFLQDGVECSGKIITADIGIPKQTMGSDYIASKLCLETIQTLVKPRPKTGHKGTFGHLLIVSGSKGKSGAAELCALGALRSGAGLVTVATPESNQPVLAIKLAEAMTAALPETDAGEMSLAAVDVLEGLMVGKKAMVIGPGLGLSDDTQQAVKKLAKDLALPMVLDADAITAIGTDREVLYNARAQRVLTPHPGEMARLCGRDTAWVQRHRFEAVKEIALLTQAVVVLKGAYSLICSPEGEIALNPTGNSAMGAGGMGDVLAGMIGAFLAQGYDGFSAARIAVFCHGLSADILTGYGAPFGIKATEVADELLNVWKQLFDFNA